MLPDTITKYTNKRKGKCNGPSLQMVQKQEAAIPDMSGLGSQLGDLDKRLLKDLEVQPEKIGTMRRYASDHFSLPLSQTDNIADQVL